MTNVVITETADVRPTRRRFAGAGFLSGLVGGVCCLGSALAIATGFGALSFFPLLMARYQLVFLLASLAAMTLVTVWLVRRHGLRHARRMLVRHAAVMVAVYALTFGGATLVYAVLAM
jgi:hypothetical protein